MRNFILGLALACAGMAASAEDAKVQAHIHLSPAGGFVASTDDIEGSAQKNGSGFTAKNIVVNLKSLKTGIELRDKHTQKHLETDKFPEAVLSEAKGQGGKGQGKIKIHGIEKPVTGTYEVNGANLHAKFTVHLPEFGITGIKYMSIGVKDDVELEVSVPVQSAK